MQIIKYTKKGSNKYELTLKDNTKLTLYTDLILKYNLLIIKNIDNNIKNEITNANLKLDCYYKTLRYLRNIKCTKDIKNYLQDYPSNIINYTITRLTKEGYLNDSRYVEAYINDKVSLSNDGYYKIYYSLKNKDLDENLIKNYLNNIEDKIWLDKINKIKTSLKTLGYQDYLINIAINNINLDSSNEDEKLQKDYEKLYNKYKNKYDKTKLNYVLVGKLYQKGYDLDKVKRVVETSNL